LLNVIQSSADNRPDGILVLPVGTGLPQVADAATRAGIGWVLLNRDVDYMGDLRKRSQVPVFGVSVDQEEVGRIQARQFAALLPDGGMMLYIMGPSGNSAVTQRTVGMQANKPGNLDVRTLRGRWTEESGYEAVTSWLRLSTSRETPILLIGSQNDYMAMGARKAFESNLSGAERERWLSLPFTGVDAVLGTGQEWVRKGLLTASVALPITTGMALELFVRALQTGVQPPEITPAVPVSFPAIERLVPVRAHAPNFARPRF
jgi:ABC-type sugar transport system substrate-binding protein